MRRRLQGVDKRLAGLFAPQPTELLGGDHDNFIAAVHGDVLRAFTAHTPHQLAEACLGVL